LRVVLIGGSSHVGKSSLAESLAAAMGWTHISTDSLARHPGRPWKPHPEKVPDDVAEHYLSLSVDELITDVLRHYRVNVWPRVEAIVASHIDKTSTARIVLEGSALWPEFVTTLDFDRIAALWLTACEEVFSRRIRHGSMYRSKSSRERTMIGKFLARTLAYDSRMVEVVNRHGLTLIDASQSDVAQLTERCLEALRLRRR
jgi:2-phosphoglycerate kinase